MRTKILSSLAFIILLIGGFMLLFSYFSLTSYFVLTALFLFFMTLLCNSKSKHKNVPHILAILSYAGVVLLSLMVFYNYYQAKDDVYSNVDHHALGWRGYQLPVNGILYGRGVDAFLQDSSSVGTVSYELQRGDSGKVTSIRLAARDFRQSLFVGKKGDSDGVSSIFYNKNTTLPVVEDGGITFQNSVDSTRLKLQIIEQPMTPKWYEPVDLVRDSIMYVFTVTNSSDSILGTDTLRNSLLVQKSYEISALMPIRTVSLFGNNLSHFNIVREHYRTTEKLYTLNNYGWLKRQIVKFAELWPFNKSFETFRNQRYLIEQTAFDTDVTIVGDDSSGHFFETSIEPGTPFFVGFGGRMSRMYFSEQGQLLFDLPQWRPLSAENDQTDIMVSSSEVTICNPEEASPYNILFHAPQVDMSDGEPSYQGNRHLFTTGISYAKGKTNEVLHLHINPRKVVEAGEDFMVDCHADDEAKAILQLANFKDKSVFQPKPFFITIFLIFLTISLSILFSVNRSKKETYMPVIAEMACMILLLVLFTTRYILCWRMSVFPPLEDISRLEYDSFVNNRDVFKYLTSYLVIALFILLVVGKLVAHFWRIWRMRPQKEQSSEENALETSFERHGKRETAYKMWIPLLAVIIELIFCMLFPRGMQILLPVACYFLIDLLFTNIFIEKEPDENHTHGGISYCFRFPFVLNFVSHLAILTMLDAGYGVMFLLYGIIHYYLEFLRYLRHNPVPLLKHLNMSLVRKHYTGLWYCMLIAGLAAILYLFYHSTTIVAALMNDGLLGNIFFVVIVFFMLLLIVWGIGISWGKLYLFTKPTNTLIIISICLMVAWVSAVPAGHLYDKILGPEGHYTHLRYRTKVLVEEWTDILNHERVSNARNVQRFRQSSENQWILDNYYNNRPHDEDPYFKMQPMSKTGAMWGAQTTDLSFLRFGIGEHGMSFAIGIFLLMLMAYVIVLWQPKMARQPRSLARQNIAINALLLILMQAIFVWMSVTNKFIFFGQDFPMLSMTSKMTIFYVLFLLVLASLFSAYIPKDVKDTPTFNSHDVQLSVVFSILLVSFFGYLYIWQGNNRKNQNLDTYSLELNGVKKVLHEHNSLLRYYQIRSNLAYNLLALGIGRSGEGYNNYGKQLFADFNDNAYLNLDEEHENISSPDCIVKVDEDNRKFPLIAEGSHLYQPLRDFYNLRRTPGSARLVMGADSVTLQLRFPQDSLYTSQERSLINEINYLFASYQIENRSLRLAELYVNKNYSQLKKDAKNENTFELQENRRLLSSNDFTGLMLDYQAFLQEARNHRGEPQNATLDSLLTHIDNVESIEGATFTNSLIEAYINNYAKNNNPDNIIYLRRDRLTGYLKFDINSNFFKIETSEEPWRGDILAKDAETSNLLFTRIQGGNRQPMPGNQEQNEHFDLIRVPSLWLQGEKDQYIFQTHAPITLLLKANQRFRLPHEQWSTIRLSNADGASVIETNGLVSVKMPDDLHHVFAKNVWINGHRRHIYPLGKRLFWMKPYSNYVKGVMADSIKQYKPAMALSHVISLDYGLSDTLFQFLDSVGTEIYRTETNEYWKQTNLSVFVGNSDGEILAMPEFKGNPFFRVSPNNQESIAKVLRRSTLFSDYSDERNLNANLNLLPLAIGPGSSLKPLTFGAVSSSFDTDWNDFQLVGSLRSMSVSRYAEVDFRRKESFISSIWDEPRFGESFDVAQYLTYSSNYFNSVITFIGSFSESSLRDGIFAPAHNIELFGVPEFPIMSVSGHRMKFSTQFRPKDVDAEPILKKRFADNYGVYGEPLFLDSTYLNKNTLDPVLRDYSRDLSLRKGRKRWLMPGEAWAVAEPSFLDFPLRADDAELSYAQKIKTITLGMRRVVSISPLKMAEMYARMFLLDNHFGFTISREKSYEYSVSYNVPAFDNSPERYLSMLQGDHSLYLGMERCATEIRNNSGSRPTAHYLNGIRDQLLRSGLHLYVKTGTIDNQSLNKEFNNQANLLAVVITNADMRQVQIRNGRMVSPDGRILKFYVIYIAQDKTLGRPKASQSRILKNHFQTGVIQRVIASSRFRQFFEITSNVENN